MIRTTASSLLAALLLTSCLIERVEIDRPNKPEPENKPAPEKKPEPPPPPALKSAGLFQEFPALSCFGTEPFWGVIVDERGAGFRDPDPANTRSFSAPRIEEADGALRVIANPLGEAKDDLQLNLSRAECNDGMSDQMHPITARIQLGALKQDGCCSLPAKKDQAVLRRYPSLRCQADGGFVLELTATEAKLTEAAGQPVANLGLPVGEFEKGRLHVDAGELKALLVERACGASAAPFAFTATHGATSAAGCCTAPPDAKAPPAKPATPPKAAPPPVPENLKGKAPEVRPGVTPPKGKPQKAPGPSVPELKEKVKLPSKTPAVTPKLPAPKTP